MSIALSLAPDGTLQIDLPDSGGRSIPILRDEFALPLIRRMLASQANGDTAIGLDGAPTRQQVWHWQRHATITDSRCPFCRAESKEIRQFTSQSCDTKPRLAAEVRQQARQQQQRTNSKAEDLGL